ncbi:hypothetical protein C2E23DRAFT_886775 [Lenzites betulinus]|nr:hypothetical protein C2E23DRAFT_886775 [Lenzites betulinus]
MPAVGTPTTAERLVEQAPPARDAAEELDCNADGSKDLEDPVGAEPMSEIESLPGDIESDTSASVFEPDHAEELSDDKWDEDDNVVAVQPVKGNKRPTKIHHTDITAVRTDAGPKRKYVTSSKDFENANHASGYSSKKLKTSATPTGLRTGPWNVSTSSPTPRTLKGKAPAKAQVLCSTQNQAPATFPTTVTPRQPKTVGPPSVRKTSSLPQSSKFEPSQKADHVNAMQYEGHQAEFCGLNEYGGLQDEDNTAEAAALGQHTTTSWKIKSLDSDISTSEEDAFVSLNLTYFISFTDDAQPEDKMTAVKHVEAHEIVRVTHRAGGQSNQSCHRWTTNDLDELIRPRFTQVFIPLTRISMSQLPPWHGMSIDERQDLFDRVFPNSAHHIETNDVVYSLMNSRITEWQSKFAAAALTILDSHFIKTGLVEPEARATWCRKQLGSSVASMKAPFMWETWDNGKKKGCFQGELVLKTFGLVHIPVIQAVPHELRDVEGSSDLHPCGALILAVLAVERALTIWLSGAQVIQTGQAGHFSADNWGDKIVVSCGVAKTSSKVANLFARAQKMSCDRWIAILDAARAHCRRHKAIQDKQAIDVEESASDAPMTESDEPRQRLSPSISST